MRLSQLSSELHWECWVRVGKIIVLVYELCHIFQGTCFTKTVFFQVPQRTPHPPNLLFYSVYIRVLEMVILARS
jgi:hypothetical protein